MEVNEARRLKELERETSELTTMLAEEMLKNRVLSFVCEKALSPAHRRAFAHEVVAGMCSGRKACHILRLARSTYGYRGRAPTTVEQQLRKRLHELALRHPRYGYRRIAALLRQEGWHVGKRHIQRLRRDEGLRVPPTKRKVIRRGVSTGLPTTATHRNHVWTWDFIADATVRGGALRILTILTNTRVSVMCWWIALYVRRTCWPGCKRPLRNMEHRPTCARTTVRSYRQIVQQWLAQNHIKTIYIEPGSPWQNGFVESFHGRFRDECLNREQLWTLTEARVVIGDYRSQYNQLRPHSRLGYLSQHDSWRNSIHPRLRSGFALLRQGWTKPERKKHEPSPRTNTESGTEK